MNDWPPAADTSSPSTGPTIGDRGHSVQVNGMHMELHLPSGWVGHIEDLHCLKCEERYHRPDPPCKCGMKYHNHAVPGVARAWPYCTHKTTTELAKLRVEAEKQLKRDQERERERLEQQRLAAEAAQVDLTARRAAISQARRALLVADGFSPEEVDRKMEEWDGRWGLSR